MNGWSAVNLLTVAPLDQDMDVARRYGTSASFDSLNLATAPPVYSKYSTTTVCCSKPDGPSRPSPTTSEVWKSAGGAATPAGADSSPNVNRTTIVSSNNDPRCRHAACGIRAAFNLGINAFEMTRLPPITPGVENERRYQREPTISAVDRKAGSPPLVGAPKWIWTCSLCPILGARRRRTQRLVMPRR
jgi:hypothetical protein